MLLAVPFIWFSSSQLTPMSRVTQEFKLEDCEEILQKTILGGRTIYEK